IQALRFSWWNGGEQRPLPPARTSVAPQEPHRSTSDRGSEVLRWGSGGGRGKVGCRVEGIGDQRLDCSGVNWEKGHGGTRLPGSPRCSARFQNPRLIFPHLRVGFRGSEK